MTSKFDDLMTIGRTKFEIAGSYVNVIPMMSQDVVLLQKQFPGAKTEPDPEMMATVVAKCVVDDADVPILTFEHAMKLSPGVLAELYVQCAKASGYRTGDEPLKNSQTQSVTCTDSAKSPETLTLTT